MKKLLNRTSLLIICVWALSFSVSAVKMLIPVGQVVGLELCDNTVTITSFDEEIGTVAKQAGLQVGIMPRISATPWTGLMERWK